MVDQPSPIRPRRRLFQHPGRVAVVVVALLAVLNLGVFLVASSDTGSGGGPRLPEWIESVTPEPAAVVRLQDTVSVDMRAGRTGTLVINGLELPPDQLDRNQPLGVVSFRPGPDKDIERWTPGDVTVRVLSWPATDDRPDEPDSFSWSFRAG